MTTSSVSSRRHTRWAAGAFAAALAAALSACSAPSTAKDSDANRTESFPFTGSTLLVSNDYATLDVVQGAAGKVTVREYRTVVGTAADDPTWALTGRHLRLGRTCASTVGICQVSYRITVPRGTTVTPTQSMNSDSE